MGLVAQSHRIDSSEPQSGRPPSDIARVRLTASFGEREVVLVVTALDKLLAHGGPHLVVCEIDDEINASAGSRRRLARELADRHDAIAKGVRAFAVVARTPTSQGLHTALRWLTPAPCPERRFDSMLEAEDWARSQASTEAKR